MMMFTLAYNLVCLVMCQAAQRQGVPPERISFVDALRLHSIDIDDGKWRGYRQVRNNMYGENMPLDHYVSQVHLRRFYSPVLGNRMYAIRKADLKAFTQNSQAVCRIMDGSTNAFLREDRAVEDFLKTIEPKYNVAVDKLIKGEIDKECIYTIAGFAAYVIVCSPAGMRIGAELVKVAVEESAALLEAHGRLPPRPAELVGERLKVRIDPKFPQAVGIASIMQIAADFGNSKWEVLHNDSDDSPFFTSDFPAAIERTGDPRILNRIIPLAPSLALRIWPDPTFDTRLADFSFANFGCRSRKLGHEKVVMLNRLIVQCAEETVFYRDDHEWVRPFISKNRHYRIEPLSSRVPTPTGAFLISTLRIVGSTAPVNQTYGLKG
jgi:hypothetical protein